MGSIFALSLLIPVIAGGGVASAEEIRHADLAVTQRDSVDPVLTGDEVVYSVTLDNRGPGTTTHTSLFGHLETGDPIADTDAGTVTDVAMIPSAPGTSCQHGLSAWRCTVDRLAVGDAIQVDVSVTAPPDPKSIFSVASAGLDLSNGYVDPDPSNSSDVAEETTVVSSFASENAAGGTDAGAGGTASTTGVVDGSNLSKSIVQFPGDGTPRIYGFSEGAPQLGIDCVVSPCHGPVTDLSISPAASVNKPFSIEIIWDRTTRDGQTLKEMTLYHDEVSVPRCARAKGTSATPDPCWKVKKILKNGDIRFVMLSSHNGHIRK